MDFQTASNAVDVRGVGQARVSTVAANGTVLSDGLEASVTDEK